MPINASLFAHIENDAFLSGTYKLTGHNFTHTIGYLNGYFNHLKETGGLISPDYLGLMQELEGLAAVDHSVKKCVKDKDTAGIALSIEKALNKLQIGQKVLLPGGWVDGKGGHGMIYQFTRKPDGYFFTVVNSGAGLEYHAKKADTKKELYNPMKVWSVPLPKTPKEHQEVANYIQQLLQALVAPTINNPKKIVDEKVLYEEIISTISYINGKELEPNQDIPEYAYTGGQLSGTCAQRSIHQMLKINSSSLESYQRFIFKFKQHALFDYADACLISKTEPFNSAVSEQINLAIDNNLKILNSPGLFTPSEFEKHFSSLISLKKSLGNATQQSQKSVLEVGEPLPKLTLQALPIAASVDYVSHFSSSKSVVVAIKTNNNSKLLERLTSTVVDIRQISDPATQYIQLEQLILSLPLSENGQLNTGIYTELKKTEDYEVFQNRMEDIQRLVCDLRDKWLNKSQFSALNYLSLSVLSLQMDAREIVAQKSGLPAFKSFTSMTMATLIDRHARDPFEATNSPVIDQRIKMLKKRFTQIPSSTDRELNFYFKSILATESELSAELKNLYTSKYGTTVSRLHQEIRAKGLESLYMIALHLQGAVLCESKFLPLINKIKKQIAYEASIRRTINPFFINSLAENTSFNLNFLHDELRIISPLYSVFVPFQELSTTLKNYKYNLTKASSERSALEADITGKSSAHGKIEPRTANNIQLNPSKPELRKITEEDIVARDYYHLRSNPGMLIALTLDYFTRHVGKLVDESSQRYVEANLFQPGLLLDSLQQPGFLPQFDNFLTTGKRFFALNGQHTRESLLFFRLDFLVSRYHAQMKAVDGILRLKATQKDLLKQLSLTHDSDVIYVLQQYLFLATIECLEIEKNSKVLFEQAVKSYFYLMSHTNPLILEDTSHQIDIEKAAAKFKIFANEKNEEQVKEAVINALSDSGQSLGSGLTGKFPNYIITLDENEVLIVNVHKGKIFANGLAKSGIPLTIRHHPLIIQLGLQNHDECFMNGDGSYMRLQCPEGEIHLFYTANNLIVQKDWFINGKTKRYELQALTKEHLAARATKSQRKITTDLPEVLTDGAMNYWQSIVGGDGILVRDNLPVYCVRSGKIQVLDAKGKETTHQLNSLPSNVLRVFNAFEGNNFILSSQGLNERHIKLPRFGLSFEQKNNSQEIINQATGETVIDCPSPIAPVVSSLVLQNKDQLRVLVPIMRFHENEISAVVSDFYPVIHDRSGIIARTTLEDDWKAHPLVNPPLWSYQDSERYVSFHLHNGIPVADTPADALYLAYMYLVTNQTEAAWKTLDDCNTRLGGLKGEPQELQYISWICKDLPYVLPGNMDESERRKPVRNTPPFVASQLKAMSLLTDYLAQDRKYDLKKPDRSDNTANSEYALLQYTKTQKFLDSLPQTIYSTFRRLQSMRRHLEHGYQLSKIERKRLLDYYHQKKNGPRGALGYEWMTLSLDALLEEQDSLLAHKISGQNLSSAEKKRLDHIQRQLKKLGPVTAVSTQLEQVAIDLTLPLDMKINQSVFSNLSQEFLQSLQTKLVANLKKEKSALMLALDLLVSNISDDDFVSHFADYLQIARSSDEDLSKHLLAFCTKTLLAKRHVPLNEQDSNIPFLCNILYRVAHNKNRFTYYIPEKFDDLLEWVAPFTVPELKIYQAKDIYHHILAKPETLIAERERQISIPINITIQANLPLIMQIGIEKRLMSSLSEKKVTLDDIITCYQKLQKDTAQEIDALGDALIHGVEQEFSIEEKAGKRLLAAEKQKRLLAQTLLSDLTLVTKLKDAAEESVFALESQVIDQWSAALILANQGPDDPVKAKAWALEKASRSRAALTRADLMSLYTRADRTYSIEKTGLSAEDAQKLHDAIHNALVLGIRQQSAGKIAEKLNHAIDKNDLSSAVMALDLLTRTEIPALDVPAIVLLQHEEQILLHDRQVNALKELLASPDRDRGFNEVVEKIIMGGGKSKVLLPILAEQKARGDNLVIVEVPQALLETNHEDLNRASQRLYGKRAYRFDFNRDSNCSPERLEQIYNQFIEIITTKGYLVTTGEAMQSLELKYIEFLLSNDPLDEVLDQQISWLDKITSLIHSHGDCIIDEAHQGLSIKKRLNYTGVNAVSISVELIENAVGLFKLIDPQFIKDAPKFSKEYDWTSFKIELATKLVTLSNSPLRRFVVVATQKYGEPVKKELIAYITNTATEISPAILNASLEEKNLLAFFKAEVSKRLPQTLVRRLDEHYGPSKLEGLTPIERTLALPYSANTIPNERSRFGNQLESINYSIQMMLINGINEALCVQRIEQWQVMARQELFQNEKLKHLSDTPTAKGFDILVGELGVTLAEINMNDPLQLKKVHAHFQHNQALIFDLLKDQTLKQIQQDSETISSNSFNHVDLYRSTQAVSGTPSNHTTFHQRLKYNKKSSLGTDGYIIEIIHDKNTRVSGFDYQNVYQFIEGVISLSRAPDRIRAIIDICATFQGVDNLSVAKEITRYFRAGSNKIIKHVLYFNDQQILCALDINKPEVPIILKTTDEKEIARILGSTPEERFTYYDQAHSFGTDLRQYDMANALVLTDEKTSSQAFLQGSMRMRGLSQDQIIEIIVPEAMKNVQRAELIEQFAKVDEISLLQDNLTAAELQMTNLIRRQCLMMIRNLPTAKTVEKRAMAQIFRSFFANTPNLNFYELYGALNKPKAAAAILEHHKALLIARWRECASLVFGTATSTEIMETDLQNIIDKALSNCLPEYEFSDNEFAIEVEIHAQMQIEVELEVAKINQNFDPVMRELYQLHWPYSVKALYDDEYQMGEYALSVNEMCSSTQVSADLFSNKLRASKNYAQVYVGQKKYTDAFLKPVFLVWYHMHNNILHATIVTPQEANDLIQNIQGEELTNSWLATTQDTLIAGKQPPGIIQNAEYQLLREQVRFFNGEFSSLLNQQTPLQWLTERTTEKLDLFANELMPYRPGSASEFQKIKMALTQTNIEGFTYIAQHPYVDLSQFDWKNMYPKIIPVQAAEYKQVAEAFVYINQHWLKGNLLIEQLQSQFNLPLSSLDFIKQHLTITWMLRSTIKCLPISNSRDDAFLSLLEPKEIAFFEFYLGMSINDCIQEYGVTLPSSIETKDNDSWKAADTKVLQLLRLHPLLEGESTLQLAIAEILLKKASSAKDLQAILKMPGVIHSLELQIIESPYCNEAVIAALVEANANLSEAAWTAVLKKSRTAFEAKILIELVCSKPRDYLPEIMVDFILQQDGLTENHLLNIAKFSINHMLSYKIFVHELATPAVHEQLFTSDLFNVETFLTYFLEQNSTDIKQLMYIIDNVSDENALMRAIPNIRDSEMLITLISHVCASEKIRAATTEAVMIASMDSEGYTINVAKAISTNSSDDVRLLSALARNAYRHYLSSQTSDWEDLFVTVCEKLHQANHVIDLQRIVLDLKLPVQLKFRLLGALGKDIVPALLLKALIEKANENQLKLLMDFDKTGDLEPNLLKKLAEKCTTPELVDKFIERSDLTDEAIMIILSQTKLTEEQLVLMLKHSFNEETCQRIYNHQSAGKDVRRLLGARLTSEWALSFLTSGKPIDTNDLIEILQHSSAVTNEVAQAILKINPLDKQVLSLLITQRITDVSILRNIVAQLFDKYESTTDETEVAILDGYLLDALGLFNKEEIIPILSAYQSQLNSKLGFELFRIFGVDILEQLPFKQMTAAATVDQLQMLIELPVDYNDDKLDNLAQRVDNSAQINTLLARTDMNPFIADILFKKSTFDGSLQSWSWLTKKQLKEVLDTTTNFNSLYVALVHNKFSSERKQWLTELHAKQAELKEAYTTSGDLQAKILAALQALRVHACIHAVRSIKDDRYKLVAETAFNLYQNLSQDAAKCFATDPADLKKLSNQFHRKIGVARQTLGEHRGYAQAFLDIFNVILTLLTFKLPTKKHKEDENWRFFKVDTASMKTVNKISDKLPLPDENTDPNPIK